MMGLSWWRSSYRVLGKSIADQDGSDQLIPSVGLQFTGRKPTDADNRSSSFNPSLLMPADSTADVHAIVFIDSRVPDIQDLLDGLKPGERAFIIDATSDGLDQIAAILNAGHYTNLSAINIVAHGASGALTLGSSTIDDADLASHAATLAAIGASLTADGDLALYACNTAAGAAGQQFIADLSAYTGADVAASTHLVGSADVGGSWTLDASTGAIEAQTPFTNAALANFQGELASTLTGQLWFGGYANGFIVPSDNQIGHINSDGSGAAIEILNTHGDLSYYYITPAVDTAAGLYFGLSAKSFGVQQHTLDVARIGGDDTLLTSLLLNPGDYIISGLAVDPKNHFIYLSVWGDSTTSPYADSGIIRLTYDPFTGIVNHGNGIFNAGGTAIDPSYFIVTATGGGGAPFTAPLGFSLDADDQKLYFAANDFNTNTGLPYTGFPATNGIFVLDLTTNKTTQLSSASQFANTNNNLAIKSIAVNEAQGIIYFTTYPVHGDGSTAFAIWEMPIGGGTATQMSLPAGVTINDSVYANSLSYDPVGRTIFFSEAGNGTGNSNPINSYIYAFQLNPTGTGIGSSSTLFQLDPAHPSTGYTTGLTFDVLATIGALSGTTTHAFQGGSGVTLLAATPAGVTDPDSGGFLNNATVTVTNAQTGDVLGIGATFSYTTTATRVNAGGGAFGVSFDSVTHTLTIANWTGFENTFAQYEAILAQVSYLDGGTSGVTQRTITWQVNDGAAGNPVGVANTATTSLNVDIDHPPVANPDVNAALTGATVGGNVVLPNDTDADNDTITVTGFTGSNGAGTLGVTYNGQYGQFTLGSGGAYTYIANNTAAINAAPANSHPVETITYSISDGHGGTASTTLKITIDRAPVAVADTGVAVAGGPNLIGDVVNNNDSDKDGDSLQLTSFTIAGNPGVFGTAVSGTYGNLTIALSGAYSYTAGATLAQQTALANAPAGSHPTEIIDYTISDLQGGTSSSTLTITLDRAPVAVVDTKSVNVGSTLNDTVLGNDTDKDGDTLQVTGFTDGAAGSLGVLFHGTYGDITLNGNGTYTYVAAATVGQQNALSLAGGHGTEVVTYSISDGNGGTSSSTLSIDVSTAPFITSVAATTTGGFIDLKAGRVVTITVNFSDPVTVTGTPELQLTDNLVAAYVSGGGSQALVFSYTVQPGDNSADLQVLSLLPNGGTIQDVGGQDAVLTNAATDLHLHVDTVAPTVTVTADHTSLNLSQGTALVTFTFSEAVQLFTINDVTVSGGSFGALTHVGVNGAGQDIYTATFTPTAGNAVAASVQIGPGTYIDASANAGAASNTLSIASDTVAPTVLVTADHNGLHAGETALVTFTFSEAVADFTLGDVVASGGSVGTFTHVGVNGSGQDVYTVVFTPTANNAEIGSVQLNAVSYTDVAGNSGATGTPVTFTGDTLAPTVSVTAAPNTLQAGQTSTVTFTFSEAVSGFTLDDVTMSGGTFGVLTHVGMVGAQDVYTVVFTPDTGNALAGSVQVDAASYTDAAGNAGAASTVVNITGDTQAPTVALTVDRSSVLAGQTALITFTFSDLNPGFALSDVVVTGGTLGPLTHVGNVNGQDVYTATLTPDASNTEVATVQAKASIYSDAAGNTNAASNTINITGDTLAPTVSVVADHTVLTAGDTALLTFTFSEDVAGFALDASHVTVTGGTLGNLSQVGNDIYTAIFTPDVSDTEVGSVQVIGYADTAGNAGAASNTVNFSGDTKAPTATLVLHQDTGSSSSDKVTSNPLIDYTKSDPAGTLLYKVDGAAIFSATVPSFATDGSQDGVHTVSVEEVDAAGNIGPAATLTFTLDTIAPAAPTLALHQDSGNLAGDKLTNNPLIDYTRSNPADTLLYKVDGAAGFSAGVPSFATDGSQDGVHTVSVEEVDAAGNISTIPSLTFTLDTIAAAAPTLALHQDTGAPNDNITSNPLIDYSKSDAADTLLYSLDGAAFSAAAPTFTDGAHTVSVKEVDAAGNASATSSLSFTLDTTAPTVSVAADNTALVPGQTALVTFDFSEVVTGFDLSDIQMDGGALSDLNHVGLNGAGHDIYTATFTPQVAASLADTMLVSTASYTDIAGNAGAGSAPIVITGHTNPLAAPGMVLDWDSGPSAADHITKDPVIDYTRSESANMVFYAVNGAGFMPSAPNFATDGSQDGVYTVSAVELDFVGNVGPISNLTFTLDTTAPHLIGITASPGSGSIMTGSTLQLTVGFNEAVTVVGGTPTLKLNDGGSAIYDAAATVLLGDASKLVFDYVVSATDRTSALAVTGLSTNDADIYDMAGNHPDLSAVTAAFNALEINETSAPAYTIGAITRPELHLDSTGHIILDAAASAFAGQYGMQSLYLGLPPGTPYPPVPDLHV